MKRKEGSLWIRVSKNQNGDGYEIFVNDKYVDEGDENVVIGVVKEHLDKWLSMNITKYLGG